MPTRPPTSGSCSAASRCSRPSNRRLSSSRSRRGAQITRPVALPPTCTHHSLPGPASHQRARRLTPPLNPACPLLLPTSIRPTLFCRLDARGVGAPSCYQLVGASSTASAPGPGSRSASINVGGCGSGMPAPPERLHISGTLNSPRCSAGYTAMMGATVQMCASKAAEARDVRVRLVRAGGARSAFATKA